MFKKGDRVRYSKQGLDTLSYKTITPGQRGTIYRQPRDGRDYISVLWDGRKSGETVHQSFIEKVPDAD